ncbi:MAG: UDPglucose 6-dehydrogenase, partial [Actinomycetota bacterium]|nr:UDPglucose 6-dehydrogenase [Actinomycetota bacterium]
MRVAVLGAGYVGLTTAACLAHLGHDVICADIDPERIKRLSKGEVPILEEGLPELVSEGLASRRLSFVVGANNAARTAEIVFLCVQTPQGEDGAADLTYVENVAREIAPVLQPGTVVVNKSTVPVGSTRFVQRVLSEAGTSAEHVTVASNPEFLREGQAVRDFLQPDRIVVGCEDPGAAVRVSELYRGLRAPLLVTDPASAEMIKYASNGFLATKVSFINAIANLCEAVDADVREVALGMGYDKRIGFEFLRPGPGYGGSCFPKDTSALLHTARSAGYDFELLEGVVAVNRSQHEHMVDKVRKASSRDLGDTVVGVWGLTFKADTDDLRDSP